MKTSTVNKLFWVVGVAISCICVLPAKADTAVCPQYEYLSSVELPGAAERLIISSPTELLAIDEDAGDLFTVTLKDANRIGEVISGKSGIAKGVEQILPLTGGPSNAYFLLRRESEEAYRIELSYGHKLGGIFKLKRKIEFGPLNFKSPNFQFGNAFVVVWERDPTREDDQIVRITGDGNQEILTPKNYPAKLFNVGDLGLMMGVHSEESLVSLIDVNEWRQLDLVGTGGLGNQEPSNLAAFVPMAFSGGLGDVILANSESRVLTVISIRNKAAPRIVPPVEISFGLDKQSIQQVSEELLLVADRRLSTILVGPVGNKTLEVFRRSGGGIERLESIELPFGIRAVGAVRQPNTDISEFAFLTMSGRCIYIGPAENLPRVKVKDNNSSQVEETADSLLGSSDKSSIQRVLASLGYKIGAIDGKFGPISKSAIRSFQIDKNIGVTGILDSKTLGLLNEVVGNVRKPEGAALEERNEYAQYIGQEVPGFEAIRLLFLGFSHNSPNHPCFGLNSTPPRHLWKNSIPLARILSRLDKKFLNSGFWVEVTSVYRNAAYNTCVGASSDSKQLDFAGMDIRLVSDNGEKQPADELRSMLNDLPRYGIGKFRVIELGMSISIDLQDKALSERPVVYLQFAGASQSVAEGLSNQLTNAGFIIPSSEKLRFADGLREVRYFHPEDVGAAKSLSKASSLALNEIDASVTRPVIVKDFTSFKGKKPSRGTIELWVDF